MSKKIKFDSIEDAIKDIRTVKWLLSLMMKIVKTRAIW